MTQLGYSVYPYEQREEVKPAVTSIGVTPDVIIRHEPELRVHSKPYNKKVSKSQTTRKM